MLTGCVEVSDELSKAWALGGASALPKCCGGLASIGRRAGWWLSRVKAREGTGGRREKNWGKRKRKPVLK